MDGFVVLEKKDFLEQQQQQQQQQTSEAMKKAEMPVPEEMQKDQKVSELNSLLKEFSSEFQNEWAKPIEVEGKTSKRNRRIRNAFRRLVDEKEEKAPYFSLNSFAYESEVEKEEDYDEKRSNTAVDLMDILTEWFEMTKDKNAKLNPDQALHKLLDLSMSAQNYLITHTSKYFISTLGKGRVKVAEKVSDMVSSYLNKMVEKLIPGDLPNEIAKDNSVDFEVGENIDTIEDDLVRAAAAYKNYTLQMAKSCPGHLPGEMLKRKLASLRLNERKMRLYRREVSAEKRKPAINDLLREFDECLAFEKLKGLNAEKSREQEADIDEMIENHLEKEGELAELKKDKIKPRSENEELEPEQLKGIEEIDNWLMRNFQNGGVLGKFLKSTKNPNVEFVNEILSMSKRERLHMYYLVENKKRRNPNMLDVGLSQGYVPTLKGFKDQMIATRFKFWKRLNGEYTYMHKLSEAYHATLRYRKELKAVAEVEYEKKQQIQNVEDQKQKEEGPSDLTVQRMQKMMVLKGALEEYSRNLKTAQKASKKKKTAAEAICKESAEYCEKLMKELVDLDEQAKKQEVYTRESDSKEILAKEGASNYSNFSNLGTAGMYAGFYGGTKFFGKSWDLKDAGWANAKLWTGSIVNCAAGAASLIGAITSISTLWKVGDQLTWAEISEKTFEVLDSSKTAMEKSFKIVNEVIGNAELGSQLTTVFSSAGAAISVGIAISQAVGVDKMERHGQKAGEFFKRKQEKLLKDKNADQLTMQQQRELKYEKYMMQLQEDLKHREEKRAAFSAAGAGLSLVSIFIPTVGFAKAVVSIVGSIIDGMEVTKLRTRLFDSFFNMDELVEKFTKERYKGTRMNIPHNIANPPQERVRESLRERVAAHAGFCDMRTASEYICTQFAHLVQEKLFGEKTSDEERKGYIEFVKALKLDYNIEKRKPDLNMLVRKMSAQ